MTQNKLFRYFAVLFLFVLQTALYRGIRSIHEIPVIPSNSIITKLGKLQKQFRLIISSRESISLKKNLIALKFAVIRTSCIKANCELVWSLKTILSSFSIINYFSLTQVFVPTERMFIIAK